jgi:metal-responsive CopG/Arc/MetJ family transcriptional regulator
MKAAVSIPDDVFKRADALAKKNKTSRSHLYAEALREYLLTHETDVLTRAMRRAHGKEIGRVDAFVKAAAEATLRRVEWKD